MASPATTEVSVPLPLKEIGKRIRQVRQEVGISTESLAQFVGVSPQEIDQIEAGKLEQLPGDYVLIIAQALNTDFRTFISTEHDDVNEETRRLFRALAEPKPSDLLALRRLIAYATYESELETLLSIKKPALPPAYPNATNRSSLHKDQGRLAAHSERKRLGLGNAPISNIFQIIRDQGIGLARQRLEDSNLSGVTILHPRAGTFIFVNFEDDLFRQFFSAAHEYSHVLFDRIQLKNEGCVVSYRYNKKELLELRANSFASEFLLPSSALEQYQRPRSATEVVTLTEKIGRDYKVNTQTVAIRLKDLGMISQRTLDSFINERPVVIPKKEKQDPEIPTSLTQQQAARRRAILESGASAYFLELLRSALIQHQITPGRFAEMLSMSPEQAHQLIGEAGLAL
ncbi:MAG TPA: ImmA/IrrE family metallo-endopeptidase [Myxococcaceae bacterium]|jgi:Zn-dependent peptidase ImmA (M78 family)/transcriptional regulator with XRE-family HTH domain